nr:ATP-binding protein [Herbaspirillum sp. ASV7]
MMPAKKLRIDIERCELQHPQFLKQLLPLKQRIEDAIDGAASRIERVIGPSRVGKSMLINSLSRDYPETKVNGRRQVPVLVVPVPTPVSPLLLPSSVLTALGIPIQGNITSGVMGKRMQEQLKLAGTRVVIFEEASHLVEVGARVPSRSAGDWFKWLADSQNLTLLLFGVPRLERLFDINEQLRMRASAARRFLPYDSRIQEGMQAFHTCVATYANLFSAAGFPIALPPLALTYQCYLLTGGLVGLLSRFMQELAGQLVGEMPRSVGFEDCRAAAVAIESVDSGQFSAFESFDCTEKIPAVALHDAYVQVMNMNELKVPILDSREGALQ